MQKLFNNILVPVDFSVRSKKAIEKASEFAVEYQCNIYLLHVITVSPFVAVSLAEGQMEMPQHLSESRKELEYQMDILAQSVKKVSAGINKVNYSVLSGKWEEVVLEFIRDYHIDLLMIGQKPKMFRKRRMLLNPDLIAEKSNIPVITIPANRRILKLYSIVIPITDFLPIRKLMYGIYMASKHNAKLKLLGIENEENSAKVRYYLQKAYQLIRDNCAVATELETVFSTNIAEAVNNYSMVHAADLIIINPGKQTRLPGFFASVFGNIIQKYSAPPVLTVNPV